MQISFPVQLARYFTQPFKHTPYGIIQSGTFIHMLVYRVYAWLRTSISRTATPEVFDPVVVSTI